MAPTTQKPWLIAAWPGMGNVALIAAGYLVQKLNMQEIAELPSSDHFDIGEITVNNGLVAPVQLPVGRFFKSEGRGNGRDVYVFLGEAQPDTGVYSYANELLDVAKEFDVERIVTFASLASALHPAGDPRVAGVATDEESLGELKRAEVTPMEDGQIGGLNGVVLAAAADHEMTGMCLLAEIPFFAATVANPKAARAALSVFCVLSGVEVSLEELGKHAALIDKVLIDAYDRLEAQGALPDLSASEDEEEEKSKGPADKSAEPGPSDEPTIDFPTRQRLEDMFEAARKDQNAAIALKQELDRLGVFALYENRFLDLFRRAD